MVCKRRLYPVLCVQEAEHNLVCMTDVEKRHASGRVGLEEGRRISKNENDIIPVIVLRFANISAA